MICNSYQYKGGNRDYRSHFLMMFETASKFLIAFVRLILGKNGVDEFNEPRGKIDTRYEFKDNFKGSRVQIAILAAIFD